jgi:hypothetical protein
MTMPTRKDLLLRFGKDDDPEIEARRQQILTALLEVSPETKDAIRREGQLMHARATLRKALARRKLVPTIADEARIEACTDLTTLERWEDQAVTARTVAEALA